MTQTLLLLLLLLQDHHNVAKDTPAATSFKLHLHLQQKYDL